MADGWDGERDARVEPEGGVVIVAFVAPEPDPALKGKGGAGAP